MTATRTDRNKELARIHCLAKEVGIARDEYEDLLFSLARVRSARDLDDGGRRRVLAHLGGLSKRYDDWGFIDAAPADRQPLLRKIAVMAKAKRRTRSYVEGITKRMFQIARLEFCAVEQLHKVVAALTYDQQRTAN